MLSIAFVFICFALPVSVKSSCCRLPFTDGECQIKRNGTHRYAIMPDGRSGYVTESTECHINDFDANYRKVIEKKNYCNDCPGLLILHVNSSEIFLFPEYLERILEGRTNVQRKNVIILTTSLTGAYDLDFTQLARYYATRSESEVPSIYVDLQLPAFDKNLNVQPSLRLRLPEYEDDGIGSPKISRQRLVSLGNNNEISTDDGYKLPYLYHFDINLHLRPPSRCNLYDIQISRKSPVWKLLDSGLSTCNAYTSHFGQNKCFATGFTRLFCAIENNILMDDGLRLSPYFKVTNRVEHLTIAVTGGHQIHMSLGNPQMFPAEQVKILLLRGNLVVNDVNINLPIRVEYGWSCEDYSLTVSAGFSATRYRRFDAEDLSIYEGNSVINLPSCFRVLPNLKYLSTSNTTNLDSPIAQVINATSESITEELKGDVHLNGNNANTDSSLTTITNENQQESYSKYWTKFYNTGISFYIISISLIFIALLLLCFGVCYCICYNRRRKATWKLEHESYTNPAFNNSKDDQSNSVPGAYVNNSTQTIDTSIRI